MTTMTLRPAAPAARATTRRRPVWSPARPTVAPAAVRACAGVGARTKPASSLTRPVAPLLVGVAPLTTAPARLTRRGRVAAVLGFVAVLGGGLAVGQATVATPTAPTSYDVLTVEPGQTLWGIANVVAPGVDPRTTVQRLVAVNGLVDADDITAGDRLRVPLAR